MRTCINFGLLINYPTVKFHTLATFANLSVEIMAESGATDITNISTPKRSLARRQDPHTLVGRNQSNMLKNIQTKLVSQESKPATLMSVRSV